MAAPKKRSDRIKATGIEVGTSNDMTIFPEDLTIVHGKQVNVGKYDIVDSTHHAYDLRADLPLVEERIADIAERGVINAVVVWEDGTFLDGRPRLIVTEGRRRVLHTRELNKRRAVEGLEPIRIKWVPTKARGPKAIILESITLNIGREDETWSSLACKLARVFALTGKDGYPEMMKVAKIQSVATLEQYLQLAGLHPAVQSAVDMGVKNGGLPLGAIATFAKVPYAEQEAKLEEVKAKKAKTCHAVAAVVKGSRAGAPSQLTQARGIWPRKRLEKLSVLIEGAGVEARALLDFILTGDLAKLEKHEALKKAVETIEQERRKKEPETPPAEVSVETHAEVEGSAEGKPDTSASVVWSDPPYSQESRCSEPADDGNSGEVGASKVNWFGDDD